MVKLPPVATVPQPESLYQVTVPVESEEAVSACPPPPAFTGLPNASWSSTVMTLDNPPQAPAVKVRDGVLKASWLAVPATTECVCAAGLVREDGLVTLTCGVPTLVSL